MAYIRIDKVQVTDRRLWDVADQIAHGWRVSQMTSPHCAEDLSSNDLRHALRNALLGGLVTLWAYADTHIQSDDSLRVTLTGLAPIVGLPVALLKALPAQWLQVREDGYVVLPGYCRKNHITARDLRKEELDSKKQHELELAAKRQRRHREKKHREKGSGVTIKPSRSRNGVTPPTGTGTGTLDHTRYPDPVSAAAAAGLGAPSSPRKSFEEDFRTRFGNGPLVKP